MAVMTRAELAAKIQQCRAAMNAGDYGAATTALVIEIRQAEDTPRSLVDIPTPGRCATCRWAVQRRPGSGEADQRLSLLCTLAGGDDGFHGGQEWAAPADARFAVEGSEWSRLAVSPDFGCVMWEAKPDA